ncbi:Transthyretin-like family protein [Ancylostoma caninum]|uniref:Transthyretin-like family protein n=1 Tax=Ancylostoma caninum TaxID=29170 RepID=A0A368H741_ANCCA|nr:Transthyretin-like family protein [Ancylostoma caninum]
MKFSLQSMLILSLVCIVGVVTANSECIWAVGRLVCNKDQKRVLNSVVEVWDKDGPQSIRAIDAIDPDDKAGLTVVDEENGVFKVEGCAADIDWLGPLHINRPEFYFKIRHTCNSDTLEEITVFPPKMKVFAPNTMDYFLDNPIVLDRS